MNFEVFRWIVTAPDTAVSPTSLLTRLAFDSMSSPDTDDTLDSWRDILTLIRLSDEGDLESGPLESEPLGRLPMAVVSGGDSLPQF